MNLIIPCSLLQGKFYIGYVETKGVNKGYHCAWQIYYHIVFPVTVREIFRTRPEVKKELWGGEFWTDCYYVATASERGDWKMVKRYIEKQGRIKENLEQLRLF